MMKYYGGIEMTKESAHYPCKLCGNPGGDEFFYYTARKVNSSVSVRTGMYEKDVVRTTLYKDVTKHSGFVCKNCRKNKERLRKFIISLIIFAACIAVFVIAGDALFERHGLIAFILGLIVVVSGCSMIGAFGKKSGSTLLVEYYKNQPNSYGYTYMTPSEASKLQKR